MTDDIVTRLREAHGKVLPDFYCNNLRFDACYHIEHLRKLAKDLYEETKVCGFKHDVPATMNWEEYEMDFLYD